MARDTSRDRILLVDEQPEVQRAVIEMLEDRDQQVVVADTAKRALTLVGDAAQPFSLVLLDLDLGGGVDDGFTLLGEIKRLQPDLPVVILTGNTSIENAKRAFKGGANDFLEKDTYLADNLEVSFEKIAPFRRVVAENKALRRRTEALERTATFLRRKLEHRYRIVGRSAVIRTLLDTIEKVAPIPRPVLVVGERGSGKELVAAAIHHASPRRDEPFITINCAAVPKDLLGSELFGHEKGAFTGADKRKLGLFELADRGTLFFDEIGNMPMEFQKSVLRVIEYQTFTRVQGTETIEVDVRIIAATNADLTALGAAGEFREDLYDRLAFETIRVPPLRERPEDIPSLAEHFIATLIEEAPSLRSKTLTPAAIEALRAYSWPGNVREMRYTIERALYKTEGDTIGPADLDLPHVSSTPGVLDENAPFDERVAHFERGLVESALAAAAGNQAKAAETLGITYDKFRYLYRKYSGK
ncbi:MAG: sigma-54-dependent Fis family transcriptional regulator [Verrucomicrobia bacterium]|nr:sigma-54-dependent Fis family transcriptional regulator [Verrucomicrobiota bacterium]